MSHFASVRRSRLAAAIAAMALVAALAFASAASAKTFTVTKRGDPAPDGCKQSDCSLREAIRAANARPGRDVVVLPSRSPAYLLAQAGTDEDGALDGDLDVSNHPLVIRHPGKGKATINGRGIERVFDVFAGASTTFRDVVVRGGVTDQSEGGGIRSDADLNVIGSRIVANVTEGGNFGGGIGLQNDAGLRLVDSVVANNESGDDGGGIDADDGPVVILRSRIARNRADGSGGGIYYNSDGPSRIVATTIDRNRASQRGGGVHLTGDDTPLRVVRTTISRNRAGSDGGGVSANSSLRLTNSTIALNRSDGDGGGLFYGSSNPAVKLNAVTVARNVADADDGATGTGTGGGLYRAAPMNGILDAFAVENSLLGLNRLGSGQRNDCDGVPIESLAHNVISTLGPAGACQGFDRPTDRVPGNPRIGGLRRNGGRTETIALRPGSVAINRAKRSSAPNRDQRNRPRGTRKDVGAFERNVGN